MSVSEFADTVSCFIRVAWAAAAGKLQLVGSLQPVKDLSATSNSGQQTSSISGRQPSMSSIGQCLLQLVVFKYSSLPTPTAVAGAEFFSWLSHFSL